MKKHIILTGNIVFLFNEVKGYIQNENPKIKVTDEFVAKTTLEFYKERILWKKRINQEKKSI